MRGRPLHIDWHPEDTPEALHRERIRLKVPRPRHEKTDRAAQAAWMLDNAPGHRNPVLKAVAPRFVPLPPYSPELAPAERIFRALRPEIEGEAYATLDAKRERAEAWLRALAADPVRLRALTGWGWLVEQIATAHALASVA